MQCGNRSMPWATEGVDPYYYHGSHVASVMGAVQNNDLGVTGIANSVKIMVLRVSRTPGVPEGGDPDAYIRHQRITHSADS